MLQSILWAIKPFLPLLKKQLKKIAENFEKQESEGGELQEGEDFAMMLFTPRDGKILVGTFKTNLDTNEVTLCRIKEIGTIDSLEKMVTNG